MPLKQHPTKPDMMIYTKTEYGNISVGKEWVSLTDEEINECAMQGYASEMAKAIITGVLKVGDTNIQIAKAVEAKLKEKNSG